MVAPTTVPPQVSAPDAVLESPASPLAPHSTHSTRRRLVESAAAVFSERGYDGTRVQEIARRAGLTTGAIYANFEGKAHLLLEAIDTLGSHELDALLFEAVGGRSATETLVSLGVELLASRREPSGALLFEALGAARRDPEVALLLQRHFRERASRLAELVREGERAGEIDPGLDVDAAVRFCLALALGFLACDLLGVAPTGDAAWEDLVARLVTSFAPVAPPRAPQRSTPRPSEEDR